MKLNTCPECGSDDLHIDSVREMRTSWVECNDCEFRFQRAVAEDSLIRRWNALERKVKGDGLGTD